MNPKSTDYRQGALAAMYNLLDIIHANNNQVTIKDIEQFQEGQLMAQDEITNNPHPIAVSKEEYIAKAQEVAAIQDGQDFGWLNEILDEIYQDKNTLGDYPVDKTIAKTTIRAHSTANEKLARNYGWHEGYKAAKDELDKKHQADLLRARIDELVPIFNLWHKDGGRKIGQFVKNQISELRAELDNLEGENE